LTVTVASCLRTQWKLSRIKPAELSAERSELAETLVRVAEVLG
jgi:hypothetical protein